MLFRSDKLKKIERVRTQGGYKSYEDVFGKEHEGSGKATRQLFDYLSEASKDAPGAVNRLMESDDQLAKLLKDMNMRDIKASVKYNVGQPRQDVLNARDILADKGLTGLMKALEEGKYLPAAAVIPLTQKKDGEE